MKALLESKDLLSEKRVMAVAKALEVDLWQSIGGQTQTVLHNSLEQVAIEMRDAMDTEMQFEWQSILSKMVSVKFDMKTSYAHGAILALGNLTAREWIIATVLACEAADAAGGVE